MQGSRNKSFNRNLQLLYPNKRMKSKKIIEYLKRIIKSKKIIVAPKMLIANWKFEKSHSSVKIYYILMQITEYRSRRMKSKNITEYPNRRMKSGAIIEYLKRKIASKKITVASELIENSKTLIQAWIFLIISQYR